MVKPDDRSLSNKDFEKYLLDRAKNLSSFGKHNTSTNYPSYDETITRFLYGHTLSQEEKEVLLKQAEPYEYGNTDINSWFYSIPNNWHNIINRRATNDSDIVSEARYRTATSGKIVMPELMSYHPHRPSETSETLKKRVQREDKSTAFNWFDVKQDDEFKFPTRTHTINYEGSLEDLVGNNFQALSENISRRLEIEIFTGGSVMDGILNDIEIIGHPSESRRSLSGYIDLHPDSFESDIFSVIQHLPQAYRVRAKWYIKKDFNLSTLIEYNPAKDRLYNKPIIRIENMGNIFPIVLADLSRAYMIGSSSNHKIRKLPGENSFEFKINLAGVILQPAAIKVLRQI